MDKEQAQEGERQLVGSGEGEGSGSVLRRGGCLGRVWKDAYGWSACSGQRASMCKGPGASPVGRGAVG